MRRRELLRRGGAWAAVLASAAGAAGCRGIALGLPGKRAARVPLPVQFGAPMPPAGLAVQPDWLRPSLTSQAARNYMAALIAPVLAAYNASQSAAEATLALPGAAQPLPVAVSTAGLPAGGSIANKAVDLTAYLREANWIPRTLLPGLVAALQWNGRQVGVPYDSVPTGVRIDLADWGRLGFPLPADDWTSAELATACTLLGSWPGLELPALGGGGAWSWPFPDPRVWAGWVWGYGGLLVDGDGRIVRTDRGAIEGIAALTAAARAARPNMCAARAEIVFAAAGRHALPPNGVLAGTGLWSFPAMPAARVIPATVAGLGVQPSYPYPQLAADCLAWLVSPAGQAQVVAVGYPSVLVDASAGSGAWVESYPPGFDHGGLRIAPNEVRPIPWQVFLLWDLLALTVWRALGLSAPSELQSLPAPAKRAANQALSLRGAAQGKYLRPYQKWGALPPGANLDCFPAALPGHMPSPYASAGSPG